jgi:hypothetical protein
MLTIMMAIIVILKIAKVVRKARKKTRLISKCMVEK